jgi:ABC-type spermidine/putrescine transport system permease subunit II
MKRSRFILLTALLGLLLVASFNLGMAFLQDTTPVATTATTSTSMPWQLWIPFVLGFVGHWYKRYIEDKVTNAFLNYFLTGVLGTITAVVGGFITFYGFYSANPAGYPLNVPGLISVFLISYTWDSLANGPSVVKPIIPDSK